MAARTTQQVSQKRIAEAAGVSQPTVSLVLSGRYVISDDTRKRVLEAAETLKYRPNLLVRGMQTGKTRVIGVMAPPFDSFWSDVLYGIHDTLSVADHVPMMVWTTHEGRHRRKGPHPGPEHSLQQINRLLDRRIDGVILWPPFATYFHDHVNEFSSRDLPIVTIDHVLPPEFRSDCVSSDEQAGTSAVAKHLYDLGHRKFAHLSGHPNGTWAIDRRRFFEQAIAATPDATCVSYQSRSEDDPTRIVPARTMLLSPDRPTAVFAATDILARKIYEAAAELKLRIPEDLSVVGFANNDFSAEMNPPLTTVRQMGYEIGSKAAQIVLDRSNGVLTSRTPAHERMPVELIVRQSTGPAPVQIEPIR